MAVAASLGGRATRLPVVLVPIPSRAAAVRERGLENGWTTEWRS